MSRFARRFARYSNHELSIHFTSWRLHDLQFEDLGACAPILGKRVTFGAAASLMATLVIASVGLLFSSAQPRRGPRTRPVKRGQYLVQIGGCNDCHTAGYAETGRQRAGERMADRRAGRLQGCVGNVVCGEPAPDASTA